MGWFDWRLWYIRVETGRAEKGIPVQQDVVKRQKRTTKDGSGPKLQFQAINQRLIND